MVLHLHPTAPGCLCGCSIRALGWRWLLEILAGGGGCSSGFDSALSRESPSPLNTGLVRCQENGCCKSHGDQILLPRLTGSPAAHGGTGPAPGRGGNAAMPCRADKAMAVPPCLPKPFNATTATSPCCARTFHGKSLIQGNFQLSKVGRGELGLGCQLGRDDGCGGTSLGSFGNSSLCCTWGYSHWDRRRVPTSAGHGV